MDSPHANALNLKHAGLEEKIREEMARPLPDISVIQKLKKQKLQIKEEMARH